MNRSDPGKEEVAILNAQQDPTNMEHQRRRICQGISGFHGRFSHPITRIYTRRKGHALVGAGTGQGKLQPPPPNAHQISK